jgi:MFS family permease
LFAFVLTQLSNLAGVIGGSILFIAMPWLVLEQTGSSAQSALVIAFSSIPGLLLAPVMGSFIDAIGRRRLAWAAEALTVLTTIAFPLIASLGAVSLPVLIILAVVRNTIAPGGQSARKSLIPDVATKAGLTLDRANSIHEAVFSAGFAIGPAVGALAIGASGAYSAFWWAGGAGALSALFAFLVRVTEKQEPASADDDKSKPLRYAVEGIKALGRFPAVAIIFIALLSLSLLYIPTEMVVLPRFYSGIGRPEDLGTLISFMAAAGVLGSLAFEWLHKRLSYANILRMTMFGITAGMVPMSFLPPQWAMLGCGLLLGLTWGPVIPLLNTVVQTHVPANLRGRVFSLEMAIWNASPMLSFILIGIAVDSVGVQLVYWVLAGGVTLATIGIALAPQMKTLSESRRH